MRARGLSAALALFLGAVIVGGQPPALAHHAVQGQFDVEKTVTVDAVLTRIELVNPHPQVYFDVKGEKGATVNWRIEAPAIAALRRMGLLRILKVGTSYKVEYSPARNGQPIALMRAIVAPDGKRYGGSLQDVTQ
jgi:Family of unknown function (DUF6152)